MAVPSDDKHRSEFEFFVLRFYCKNVKASEDTEPPEIQTAERASRATRSIPHPGFWFIARYTQGNGRIFPTVDQKACENVQVSAGHFAVERNLGFGNINSSARYFPRLLTLLVGASACQIVSKPHSGDPRACDSV